MVTLATAVGIALYKKIKFYEPNQNMNTTPTNTEDESFTSATATATAPKISHIQFDLAQNPAIVWYEENGATEKKTYQEAIELWGEGCLDWKLQFYAEQVKYELYQDADGLHRQPQKYVVPLGLGNIGEICIDGVYYSYLPNPGVFVPADYATEFRLDPTKYQIRGKVFEPEVVVGLLFKNQLTPEQWGWVVTSGLSASFALTLVKENEKTKREQEEAASYEQFLRSQPKSTYTFYKKGRSFYVNFREYKVSSMSVRGVVGYSWRYVDRGCNIKANGELGLKDTNDFHSRAHDATDAIDAWLKAGKPESFKWEAPR